MSKESDSELSSSVQWCSGAERQEGVEIQHNHDAQNICTQGQMYSASISWAYAHSKHSSVIILILIRHIFRWNSSLHLTSLNTVPFPLSTPMLNNLCKKDVYSYQFSGRSSLVMSSGSPVSAIANCRGGRTDGWAIKAYG